MLIFEIVHEFLHVMLIVLVQMADVEASYHGGDGGGEDPSRPRPPTFGCGGCFANMGKNF